MNDLIGIAVAIGVLVLLIMFLVSQQDKQKRDLAIICPNPNCGYRGPGKKTGASDGCLVLILLILGILPGILYLLFCGNRNGMVCPKCGMKVR